MTSGSDGEVLFEGRFYRATLEPPSVVRLKRSAVAMEPDGVRGELERMAPVLSRLDQARTGLLIDVRDAPMRNDPAFEKQSVTLRPATFYAFKHNAVLVRTAVGRLQINRLNSRDHIETAIFMDEAEALAHLRHAVAAAPARR